MLFSELPINIKLKEALDKESFITPTEVQSMAIPEALHCKDLRVCAQTGTGKTLAFLLPTLHRLLENRPEMYVGPRALVLAPTRELAEQIAKEAEKLCIHIPKMRAATAVGGLPYPKQMRHLGRCHDILIATPGRLIDLLERKKISLRGINTLILDEADRMVDMGFIEPIRSIIAQTPKDRQTLFFSATLSKEIKSISEEFMSEPHDIHIHQDMTNHDKIDQIIHYVDDLNHKNRILQHILDKPELEKAIIFTSTKRHVDVLVDSLRDDGYPVEGIHGDMSQRQRNRSISKLKTGPSKILVATEVAARGIDIRAISHVINFDLPQNMEDYVHRIGRTGRAGQSGTALSLVSKRDQMMLKKIQGYIGYRIRTEVIEGLEPQKKNDQNSKSEDSQRRNNRGKGSFQNKRKFSSGKNFGQQRSNSSFPKRRRAKAMQH